MEVTNFSSPRGGNDRHVVLEPWSFTAWYNWQKHQLLELSLLLHIFQIKVSVTQRRSSHFKTLLREEMVPAM